jgi:hypothetical protein
MKLTWRPSPELDCINSFCLCKDPSSISSTGMWRRVVWWLINKISVETACFICLTIIWLQHFPQKFASDCQTKWRYVLRRFLITATVISHLAWTSLANGGRQCLPSDWVQSENLLWKLSFLLSKNTGWWTKSKNPVILSVTFIPFKTTFTDRLTVFWTEE